MLELHLAAYASLSDRSPSILLLPARRKLSPVQSRGTCLSLNFFSMKFPFQVGPSLHGSFCGGAGKERDVAVLELRAALAEPAQVHHRPGCHLCTDFLCAGQVLGETQKQGVPLHHLNPSFSLVLFFYLKLLSQEKFPRRGIIGNTWTCCDRTRGNSLKL